MSDVEALTHALECDHRNTILQAMLTDELMAAKDMLRSEAEKHVDQVVKDVAAGPKWYAATERLRGLNRRRRRRLYDRLREWCGLGNLELDFVVIKPGTDTPESVVTPGEGGWDSSMVVVSFGAEWLLDQDLS